MTDTLTLGILLFPWALWLVWEIFLLVRRGVLAKRHQNIPKTISMVARDARFRLAGPIYLTAGMCAHWWVPWRAATDVGSVVFWLIAMALVTWDVLLWRRELAAWERWARLPLVWLALGFGSGLLLFPQAA